MKNRIMQLMFFAAVATGVVTAQFDLSRHTIDGGGVIQSTGGEFELSGTMGQPDAGVLTGGGFQLTGGFWFEVAPTDCNDDGTVDLFDHGLFTQCLTGPDAGVLSGCACFDVDRTGVIDLRDFATAQSAHTGS